LAQVGQGLEYSQHNNSENDWMNGEMGISAADGKIASYSARGTEANDTEHVEGAIESG